MSESDRNQELKKMQHCLNTDSGKALVQELKTVWDTDSLMGDNAEDTAYNVGLRDAFRFIELLQSGELMRD